MELRPWKLRPRPLHRPPASWPSQVALLAALASLAGLTSQSLLPVAQPDLVRRAVASLIAGTGIYLLIYMIHVRMQRRPPQSIFLWACLAGLAINVTMVLWFDRLDVHAWHPYEDSNAFHPRRSESRPRYRMAERPQPIDLAPVEATEAQPTPSASESPPFARSRPEPPTEPGLSEVEAPAVPRPIPSDLPLSRQPNVAQVASIVPPRTASEGEGNRSARQIAAEPALAVREVVPLPVSSEDPTEPRTLTAPLAEVARAAPLQGPLPDGTLPDGPLTDGLALVPTAPHPSRAGTVGQRASGGMPETSPLAIPPLGAPSLPKQPHVALTQDVPAVDLPVAGRAEMTTPELTPGPPDNRPLSQRPVAASNDASSQPAEMPLARSSAIAPPSRWEQQTRADVDLPAAPAAIPRVSTQGLPTVSVPHIQPPTQGVVITPLPAPLQAAQTTTEPNRTSPSAQTWEQEEANGPWWEETTLAAAEPSASSASVPARLSTEFGVPSVTAAGPLAPLPPILPWSRRAPAKPGESVMPGDGGVPGESAVVEVEDDQGATPDLRALSSSPEGNWDARPRGPIAASTAATPRRAAVDDVAIPPPAVVGESAQNNATPAPAARVAAPPTAGGSVAAATHPTTALSSAFPDRFLGPGAYPAPTIDPQAVPPSAASTAASDLAVSGPLATQPREGTFSQRAARGAEQELPRADPKTNLAIEAGLDYLARCQQGDGSWHLQLGPHQMQEQSSASLESPTAATGLALLAFLGGGYHHQSGKHRAQLSSGLAYLMQGQHDSGDLYVPQQTASDQTTWLYSHAIATMALCEAYGMTADPQLRTAAQRALDFIVSAQHPTLGGWRYAPGIEADTSVSGWMVVALKSGELAGLQVSDAVYQGVRQWLEGARFRPDQPHLYRYNPYAQETREQRHGRIPSRAMSAVGMIMNLYLGAAPRDADFQAGMEQLRRYPPRFGTLNAPQRDAYYWYYATLAAYYAGGPTWESWNRTLRDTLLTTQVGQGEWAGSWDPLRPIPDRWATHGGRLYVTVMHLLSLEVEYRHLPLYHLQAPPDPLGNSKGAPP